MIILENTELNEQTEQAELVNSAQFNGAVSKLYHQDFYVKMDHTPLRMRRYHYHDGYELHLCVSGSMKFYIQDRIYMAKSHTLTMINSDEIHKVVSDDTAPFQRYVVSFRNHYLDELLPIGIDLYECMTNRFAGFSNSIELTPDAFEKTLPLFAQLYKLYAESFQTKVTRDNAMITKLVLAQLMVLINSLCKTMEDYIPYKNQPEFTKIQPILQYIRQNLDKKQSLGEICTKFGISKSTLIELFKNAVDMTPNRFIIYEKIARAKLLLKQGLPIAKVCEQTGFSDQSHFTRTFKSEVGVPPRLFSREALR